MVRERFAGMISKDITEREADALKDAAREVFSLEAKGRGEKHTKIAQQYLMERVRISVESCNCEGCHVETDASKVIRS